MFVRQQLIKKRVILNVTLNVWRINENVLDDYLSRNNYFLRVIKSNKLVMNIFEK